MIKKIFLYIQNHFLLRNITLAICILLVVLYAVSLLLNKLTRHGEYFEVPEFVGKTLEESQPLTKEANLKIEIIDSLYIPQHKPGEILEQSPKPGMNVKSGRNIFVVVNAQRPRTEIIPYVTGYSLRQAKNILETKGFVISHLEYVTDVATNNVLDEFFGMKQISRNSKVEAELGSGIRLKVGRNPSSPLPIVPKVVGLTLREAKSRLWEMGLNVGDIVPDGTYESDQADQAKVWKQVPNQQERTIFGMQVALYMTIKPDRVQSGIKASNEMSRVYVEDSVTSDDKNIDVDELYDIEEVQ